MKHRIIEPAAAMIGLIAALTVVGWSASPAHAQRVINFPPPQSKPPPPAKAPPRTRASGEETSVLPDFGPTMRKTQDRRPPPPTNLTIMYKVQYGQKLKYVYPDGRQQVFEQWQSYKDDGYQLIRATNERLKDGNNYQYAVKPLSSPGFDPVDIPLLYMTGDYAFALSESEVENLRKFILDGGTIIFNAARGRDEFSLSVVREMKKVFPQKDFMKLPLDHPIYNARYRIKQVLVLVNGVQFTRAPEIYSLDVGTRSAAILIPGGMGAAWSNDKYHPAGKHIVGESAVRLGVNLVSYVLGITEYGRFMAQEFPVYTGASRDGDVVRFAQVRYAGSWDVNPVLQNAVMQGLKDNTGIDVDYAPHVIALDDEAIGDYPLIFITGHYDFEWTDKQITGLRDYLNKGGTLVASAAAGLKPFDEAFQRELKRVFSDQDLIELPPSHPLFAAGWNRIGRVEYTSPALRDDPTLQFPEFYGLFIDDRLAVIYTPFDLFSAVNRESNAYAKGVTSDDALRVALNIVVHALSH
ncbi:MAG: hypothetical protein CMJ49_07370 [Planctomycetaceae bacterium]|nr:hypothetical protein [Planctomycetaceae bacterium]